MTVYLCSCGNRSGSLQTHLKHSRKEGCIIRNVFVHPEIRLVN